MTSKIGLFGFGVVGQGFYQILSQMNGTAPGHVARICVRDRRKSRPLPLERFSFNPADILDDPDITHVVELIDQADDAYDIVRTALAQGKTVISANKKMLAKRLPELLAAEQTGKGRLLYEASACGSIPIFQNLEQYYQHDEITAIRGIFNGSTNYILTQMTNNNLDFEQALALAQQLGFAETDPTLDIDAHDPASKLSLLTAHAFGQWISPEKIFRFGLRNIRRADTNYAAAEGRKIRLIASASKNATGALETFVLPVLVGAESPFYNLNNEYNGVLLNSKYMDHQMLSGKGAGGLPTGFAVLSDLANALRSNSKPPRKVLQIQEATPSFSQKVRLYWRHPDPANAQILPFEKILWQQESEAGVQVLGEIFLQNVVQPATALAQSGGFLAIEE